MFKLIPNALSFRLRRILQIPHSYIVRMNPSEIGVASCATTVPSRRPSAARLASNLETAASVAAANPERGNLLQKSGIDKRKMLISSCFAVEALSLFAFARFGVNLELSETSMLPSSYIVTDDDRHLIKH